MTASSPWAAAPLWTCASCWAASAPNTVHNLYFKRFPVVHEKDVIAIPTTCGTGSECTNISVAIVKDEKDGVLTGGETKLGLVSDDIIPNKVCLIPDLIKTLPTSPLPAPPSTRWSTPPSPS